MDKELITAELKEVDENRAEQIRKWFEPMIEMLDSIEEEYKQLMEMPQSKEKSSAARGLRLRISKVRIEANKEKDKRKKAYIIAERAIQSVFNVLKHAVVEKEETLKEIENYYELLEQKRIADLKAQRESELAKYGIDPISNSGVNLGEMAEDAWKIYREGAKKNYEARIEAERQAEEERFRRELMEKEQREAERAELLRVKQENERLRKEQEKIEAELAKKEQEPPREEKILEFISDTEEKEIFEVVNEPETSDADILKDIAECIIANKDRVKSKKAADAIESAANSLTLTALTL